MQADIKAVFGRVWPQHVASLTRFLIASRAAFGGDLDMFLVLAVIGDRTFSERHADPNMDYESFRSGNASFTPRLDINLRSIAAFSGIPRETVRRKVAELEKRGWVVRAGNGSLAATAKAKADLEPLTDASIQYLGAMLDLLASSIPATREKDRQMEDGAARED